MGLLKKVLYKLSGTSEELQRIYVEKGVCDEYFECYKKLHNKPTKLDRITVADFLIYVGRYEEAEGVLDRVKSSILDDDDIKTLYNFELMYMYILTGRREEANNIYLKYHKLIDVYFSSRLRSNVSVVYYDNAAVLAALNGNEQAAINFHSLVERWSEKYDETKIMPRISYVNILYAFGRKDEADEEYEAVKKIINDFSGYKTDWQKESFLRTLERSKIFYSYSLRNI